MKLIDNKNFRIVFGFTVTFIGFVFMDYILTDFIKKENFLSIFFLGFSAIVMSIGFIILIDGLNKKNIKNQRGKNK